MSSDLCSITNQMACAKTKNSLQARAEVAEASAERLREVLAGIVANADTAFDLSLFRSQCRDFARKALEDDKQ